MSSELLGPPIALRDYLSLCEKEPDCGDWMVFQGDDFKLDTLLYPVLLDTSEMELDEYVQAEGRVLEMGYANCLHADQLADILSNLRRQKPGYTDEDLEASINHYAEHDCFLEFGGAAGE